MSNVLLALVGLVQGPTSSASPIRAAVFETIKGMSLPGIEVQPIAMPCGQVNAAYMPATHGLILCTEMLEQPLSMIRFVVAHEMAHAIIDQYGLPVPGSEETAADELAAIYLGSTGQTMAILETGVWYAEHPDDGEQVWDDHPSNAKRAATLMCLGDGAEDDSLIRECRYKYIHAEQTWTKLVAAFGPHVPPPSTPE